MAGTELKVLAQIPGGVYLVQTEQGRGVIVHAEDGFVSHEARIGSLLAHTHGYWEKFQGDPAPILARIQKTGKGKGK